MKIKILFISIFMILFFYINCFADSIYVNGEVTSNDLYNYVTTTDKDIPIAWDNSSGYNPDLHDYEVILYNPERDYEVTLGTTDETTYTFKCPKTGHWIPKVRIIWMEDGVEKYTSFASSDDATVATVNGENKAWWIHAWIASTGGIIVGNQQGP